MQVIESNGGGRTPRASSVAPSTSPPIGRRLRRRRAPAATAGGLGNGGCKRRAAGATVEIALSVHACGQSALGARPRARAATGLGASMEPVRCAAGPRRSAARRRLPDRSGRLRTRSRRTRLEAGHWHPALPYRSAFSRVSTKAFSRAACFLLKIVTFLSPLSPL